jgi:hypothetical protein
MFVAEEKRFDVAQPGLAYLHRSGALITPWWTAAGQGMTGAVRLGLLASPRRCRTAPVSRPVDAS